MADSTRIGTGAWADAPVFRHLAPDVHVAGIDAHMIVLKLSHDRYFNLSYAHSQALRRLIGWRHEPAVAADMLPAMQDMFDAEGLLAPGERATPDSRLATRDMAPRLGFDAWLAMPGDLGFGARTRDVMLASYWLWQAQRTTRRARMAGVIDRVNHAQQVRHTRYGLPGDYAPYVAAMHRAALVYPQCTPCLPWYAALAMWCAHDGLRLQLVVGVQRQPFYAHAWAEAQGRVIGDDPRRREQLAVIYETPA
ncbi:lasso peptide biosynthesis B2 protein [Pandoraea sp. NPDC087047]|uniref:lasso peptide biosynthesis B2 protein n=1 Tax=Pandoraea sp. NPDC087047 TaxID=3364390 RepID=UPI0037F5F16F